MGFTSYGFICFLALLFPLYYLAPVKWQGKLLLAASCLFYGAADLRALLLILTTAATVYLAAVVIDDMAARQRRVLKERREELSREERAALKAAGKKRRRLVLWAALVINLGLLFTFKYANFFLETLYSLFLSQSRRGHSVFLDIALPMGISFYTFQAVGYLIDVYRGTVPAERDFFRFALFVSFFPQLVQGPISRYGDLSGSLYAPHFFDPVCFCRGLQRVLWGFFKKLVIADRIRIAVLAITGGSRQYTGAYVFAGMLFYALELYADFTGGIDIALGVSQALGITVKENFLRPYFSKSVQEYWRRWHISMGTWFADYVLYPLSASRPMLRLSRSVRARFGDGLGRRLPVWLSSLAVWLATGLWHGAGWNYIAWGLGNWGIITVSRELGPLYRRFHSRFAVAGKSWFKGLQALRTLLLMSLLRLFDCYRSVPLTLQMAGGMLTARNWGILADGSLLTLGLTGVDFGILAAGLCLLLSVSLLQRRGSVRERIGALPYPVRFFLWFGLFLAVLLLGVYGIGYDKSQFIYDQF